MLFNSFEYLVFFPSIVLLYFLLPNSKRWFLLLIASYYFYMSWNAGFILLIVFSTLVDYWAGIQMGKQKERRDRKRYLWVSLLSNLGLLFAFKYFNFFNGSFEALADLIGWNYPVEALSLILPVGISFYTFQTLSYSIEVYWGKMKPEKHLGIFALYVSFFPQLVAGPIERPQNLLPQFKRKHNFNFENVKYGLTYVLWGLFKKSVIADRIANIIDPIFADVGSFPPHVTLAATVLFAFQIFCDFSGYSDIAIGSARVMGFNLMKNFDRPYFSKSISEFWKRWHISLSSWFKDYVYIPMGGNRVVKWRWYYNLFITFLVSGLWHGAAWTFVIWGALHGMYLVFGTVTANYRREIKKRLGIIEHSPLDKIIMASITFLLVVLGWVFFRAEKLSDAVHIVTSVPDITLKGLSSIASIEGVAQALGSSATEIAILIFSIFIMEAVHFLRRDPDLYKKVNRTPIYFKWPAYYFLILLIVFFGVFDAQEFIYFQF